MYVQQSIHYLLLIPEVFLVWKSHSFGLFIKNDLLNFQILTQGIVSLFVAMYGIIYIAGDFKEIRATVDLENKSWETVRNIPSFYIFNHRGKALSPNYIPPAQKSSLEEIQS
jgi:hypothetical protein